MISKLRSPVYVQVEITSDCNNRCFHCYNFWRYGEKKQRRNLSLEEWGRVSEILGENDIFYVTVTGGEPFFEKRKLYAFLNFLCEQNIRILINSNATLINKDDAKKLSEYPIEIFLATFLSCDAERHNHFSNSRTAFNETVKGIRLLQEQGINVSVNMVATKLNYHEVYSTGKWVYDYFGIKNFSATPICPSVKDHQQFVLDEKEVFKVLKQLMCLQNELGQKVDILEVLPTCLFAGYEDENLVEIFSKRMCTAGNTTITIGSEGDVRVCSYDDESYGNLLKDDFQLIWRRMSKWRDNSLLPNECKDCIIVDSCGGGCRVNSKIRTGYYCELDELSRGKIEEKRSSFFSKILEVPMNSKFSLLNNLSFREEGKDVFIVVANPMYFIITNTEGLRIMSYLRGQGSFIPNEVISRLKVNQKIGKNFFLELYNKGFLTKS